MAAVAAVSADLPVAAWVPAVVVSMVAMLGAVYVISQSSGWRRQVLVATAMSQTELAFSNAAEAESRARDAAAYINQRWPGRVYRKNELLTLPGFSPDYHYNYALYYLLSGDTAGRQQQLLADSVHRLQAYWEGVLQLSDKELLPAEAWKAHGKPWVERGEAYRLLMEPLAMAAFARQVAPVAVHGDYLHATNRPAHFALVHLQHRQRFPEAEGPLDTPQMQHLLQQLQVVNHYRTRGWRATID